MSKKITLRYAVTGIIVFLCTIMLMGLKETRAYAGIGDRAQRAEGNTTVSILREWFTTRTGCLRPVDLTEYAQRGTDREFKATTSATNSNIAITINGSKQRLKKERYYLFVSYDTRTNPREFYRTQAFDISWVKQHPFGIDQNGFYGVRPRVKGAYHQTGRTIRSSQYIRKGNGKNRYTIRIHIDQDKYSRNNIEGACWTTYKGNYDSRQPYVSIWAFPESMLLQKIRNVSQKWYNEVTDALDSEENYYFGIDGVIDHRSDYGRHTVSTYTWKRWEEGKRPWRWDMQDRYARYFSTKGNKPTPPIKTKSETYSIVKSDHEDDLRNNEISNRLYKVQKKTKTDKSAPMLNTYNYSKYRNKTGSDYKYFDISQTIPTTEKFTTGQRNSTWYGEIDITRVWGQIRQTNPIDYVSSTYLYDWGIVGYTKDGTPIYGYRGSATADPGEIPQQYYGWSYFFISALNVRQLKSTQTMNGAYDVVYYTNEDETTKLIAKQGSEYAENLKDYTKLGVEMMSIPYFVSIIKPDGSMVYYSNHSNVSESDYQAMLNSAKTFEADGQIISARANNRDLTNHGYVQHHKKVYVADGDFSVVDACHPNIGYAAALSRAENNRDRAMENRVNSNYKNVADSTTNDVLTLNNQNYLDESNCYIAFNGRDKAGWWMQKNGYLVKVPSGNGDRSDAYARYAKPKYEREVPSKTQQEDDKETDTNGHGNTGENNSTRKSYSDGTLGDYYIRDNEDSKAGIGCSGSASISDINGYRHRCTASDGHITNYSFGDSTPVGGDIMNGSGDFAHARSSGYYSSTLRPFLDACRIKYPKGDNLYTFNKVGHCPDFVQSECDVTIPEKTKNGRYYSSLSSRFGLFIRQAQTSKKERKEIDITAMRDGWPATDDAGIPINNNVKDSDTEKVNRTAIYKQKIWLVINGKTDDRVDPKWSEDDNYENGKGTIVGWKSYIDNEPVVVHSPAIAPFSIKGSEHTQIVRDKNRRTVKNGYKKDYGDNREFSTEDGNVPQLVLDRTYKLKFNWKNYFEKKEKYNVGYNAPAGFEKYISRKEIRFPFAVEINGVFYDVLYDENGLLASKSGQKAVYTQWIGIWDKTGSETRIKEASGDDPVYEVETDADGNTVYDSDGNPVYKKDANGNYMIAKNDDGSDMNSKKKNSTYTFDVPNAYPGRMYISRVISGDIGTDPDSIEVSQHVPAGRYTYDGEKKQWHDNTRYINKAYIKTGDNVKDDTAILIDQNDPKLNYPGVDYIYFYIPSWANEGVYGADVSYLYREYDNGTTGLEKLKSSSDAYNSSIYQIEARVFSNNYNDETNISTNMDINDALKAIEDYKNAVTPGGQYDEVSFYRDLKVIQDLYNDAVEAYEKDKTEKNKKEMEKNKKDYDEAVDQFYEQVNTERYGGFNLSDWNDIDNLKSYMESYKKTSELIEKNGYTGETLKQLNSVLDTLQKEIEALYKKAAQRSANMDPEYNHTGKYTDTWGNKHKNSVTNMDVLEMTDDDMSKYRSHQYYVARYSVPCQVSGTIYGLQLDAINDERDFDSNYSGKRTDGVYSFVSNKEEKKNGTKNRFKFYDGESFVPDLSRALKKNGVLDKISDKYSGNAAEHQGVSVNRSSADKIFKDMVDFISYTLDGETTSKWNSKNTLAMTAGKSNSTAGAGALHPGHKISLQVKTIANLSGSEDYVEMIPHYRYVSQGSDTVTDNIDIWYKDDNNRLVKMGSEQDVDNMQSAHLGDTYFTDSLYDYLKLLSKGLLAGKTPVDNTAAIDNKTVSQVLNTETKVSCLSHIVIPSQLRLFTADEGEMFENLGLDATASKAAPKEQVVSRFTTDKENFDDKYIKYGIDSRHKMNGEVKKKNEVDTSILATLPEREYKEFEKSMQTWYATYQIPTNIYVCRKGALEEYAKTHEDITDFPDWYKTGKLILSFEIYTYQTDDQGNHHRHLEYTTRMEAAENPDRPGLPTDPTDPDYPHKPEDPDDPYAPYDDPKNPEPTNPTDVGEIDLTTTLADRYSSDPLYIE